MRLVIRDLPKDLLRIVYTLYYHSNRFGVLTEIDVLQVVSCMKQVTNLHSAVVVVVCPHHLLPSLAQHAMFLFKTRRDFRPVIYGCPIWHTAAGSYDAPGAGFAI